MLFTYLKISGVIYQSRMKREDDHYTSHMYPRKLPAMTFAYLKLSNIKSSPYVLNLLALKITRPIFIQICRHDQIKQGFSKE